MKKIFTARLWRAFTMAAFASSGLAGPVLAATYPISYHLPKAGRVSLNVYDSSGGITREVLHTVQQAAGDHTVIWDGLKFDNSPAPAGSYNWKLLETPGGLTGHYLFSLGSNYPIITNNMAQDAKPPGSACTPSAIAADASGLYVGSAIAEVAPAMVKVNTPANTRAWTMRYGDDTPVSIRSIASDAPNNPTAPNNNEVYRLTAAIDGGPDLQHVVVTDATTGGVWSGGGENGTNKRSFAVDWNGESSQGDAPGGISSDYDHLGATDMDLYNDGGTGLGNRTLAVSYYSHNAIRWYDPDTGAKLDEAATVTNPAGVAVGPGGVVYVSSGNQIVSVTRANHTPTHVVTSGLTSPGRIAYDYSNNTLLVWDGGAVQQVKRFTVAGALVGQPYGAAGGRQIGDQTHSGLYVPTNFLNVTDLCADGSGGFYAAEPYAPPRRVAHFNSAGTWLNEWYGGQELWTDAHPEPNNPGVVWMTSGLDITNTIFYAMRFTVDYNAKTWQLHSCYQYRAPLPYPNQTGSTASGNSTFNICQPPNAPNGAKYFVVPRGPRIFKIDETNWTLKPLLMCDPNDEWIDGNGDGLDQPGEHVPYPGGGPLPQVSCEFIDNNLDWYYGDLYDYTFYKVAVTGYNQTTFAPIYGNLPKGQLVATPPARFYSQSPYTPQSEWIFHDTSTGNLTSGNLYAAFNPGNFFWGLSRDSFMQAWSSSTTPYTPLWSGGSVDPNEMNSKNNVPAGLGSIFYMLHGISGTTHNCVMAVSYTGGVYKSPTTYLAPSYCWDQDGLFVGGAFDSIDPATSQLLYLDGAEWVNSTLYTQADGTVYFFAQWANEMRVYQLTGWDNWYRASSGTGGGITVTTKSANATGQGLTGEYFDNQDFTGLAWTETDPQVNFNWGAAAPTEATNGTPTSAALTSPNTYSARWRGGVTADYGPSYSTDWQISGSAVDYGGTYRRTTVNSGLVQLNFYGTSMSIIGSKEPDGGQFSVSLNGAEGVQPQGTFDCYSATEQTGQTLCTITGLPNEVHQLTIQLLGTHVASSSGCFVYLETLTSDGGNMAFPARLAPTVDFKFKVTSVNGAAVDVVGYRWPDGGKAYVAIDGVAQTDIDSYSANIVGGQTLFSKTGVSTGDHVLTIQNLAQGDFPGCNSLTIDKYTVDGVDVDDTGLLYTFTTNSDDGAELWVNNSLLIGDWYTKATASNKVSQAINLLRDQQLPIQLDMFKGTGNGQISLSWSNPFNPTPVVVPTANLFPGADGAPTPLATDNSGTGCIYDGIDTTTQGNWTNSDPAIVANRVYGKDGYHITNGDSAINDGWVVNPPYVTPVLSGLNLNCTGYWPPDPAPVGDNRALWYPPAANRIAAYWYCYPTLDIDLNMTDANWHRFGIYVVDYLTPPATVGDVFTVTDANGNVLDTRNISSCTAGKYIFWNLKGHVHVKVLLDSVHYGLPYMSAFFFDPPTNTIAGIKNNWLNVSGNTVIIPDGANTPDTTNGSDFGTVNTGSYVSHTLTIANTGTASVNLNGTPLVSISGTNAADFSVTTQPTTPVAATTGTTTFVVKFTPSAAGLRTARISIANDSDDAPYDFAIQGTGSAAPICSLTAPANNATFNTGSNITLSATASETGGTINKVEFYQSATLLGTDTTSPYSITWNAVAHGNYVLTAKAYDTGTGVTTSSAVNITVNTAPTCSLTAPANNAMYVAPSSIALTATAADSDGTISKVEFYQGTTLLGTDTTSPYSFTWNSPPAGLYSITAKAYDNNTPAAVTTSSVAKIYVFANADIGAPNPAGSGTYTSPTFTVKGGGYDIGGTSDQVHYLYLPITGDCTIITRVNSISSSPSATDAWAKGAVVIREFATGTSAAGARAASMELTPTTTNGVSFQHRDTQGGATTALTHTGVAPAYWLKLQRAGNNFTASYSSNGTTWTALVTNQSIAMSSSAFIGLAVSSHVSGTLCTGTFNNVSITQP